MDITKVKAIVKVHGFNPRQTKDHRGRAIVKFKLHDRNTDSVERALMDAGFGICTMDDTASVFTLDNWIPRASAGWQARVASTNCTRQGMRSAL